MPWHGFKVKPRLHPIHSIDIMTDASAQLNRVLAICVCIFTAATLLASSSAALAQAYQCRIPRGIDAAPPVRKPADEPRRVKPVDGYLLALSWSPEFCRTRQESRRHQSQCGGTLGDFGFILHGLWPETRGRDYPQWCAGQVQVPRETVRRNMCTIPSARLLRRQWAKHGSCMTRKPDTYFRISRIMYDAVRYPDMSALSRRPLTIGAFRKAFAAANPGLEHDMLFVKTNGRGWLEEVRVCLGKNFRPRRCPAHNPRQRANREIKIWRGS